MRSSVSTNEGQDTNMQTRRRPPQAAFIIIGIALMMVGMTTNAAFIGAGALFMIIGMAAVVKHKEALRAMSEAEEAQPPGSEPEE
jgi:hypothetical protein